ncbi:chaplin [Streptomyces sp. MJP52]|uniref:chaplin n=1 Tax=Streptomyces sp. MJP52 TaxID=2940555 RepID=UPI00247561B2|nr:chaplin [Streptomyces sp. MJP52]MDH6226912.1 LPXTG-motif cell wall-anchored protein [Streptomyces sp. MJP52]
MAAAATGLLAAYGAPAFADSEAEAQAANSPGVVSGNVIQVPVNVPVNVCGNTIDIIALLNPAIGNTCVTDVEVDDEDGHGNPGGGHQPHNPPGHGHDDPPGYGHDDPPGNGHENPPGNGQDKPPAPGQENPPKGDQNPPKGDQTPPADDEEPPTKDSSVPPAPAPHGNDGPQLAETGAADTAAAAAAAAALIGGGALLYRRGRVGSC